MREVNEEVFCGWGQAPCVVREGRTVRTPFASSLDVEDGIQEFPNMLFDWTGTTEYVPLLFSLSSFFFLSSNQHVT